MDTSEMGGVTYEQRNDLDGSLMRASSYTFTLAITFNAVLSCESCFKVQKRILREAISPFFLSWITWKKESLIVCRSTEILTELHHSWMHAHSLKAAYFNDTRTDFTLITSWTFCVFVVFKCWKPFLLANLEFKIECVNTSGDRHLKATFIISTFVMRHWPVETNY